MSRARKTKDEDEVVGGDMIYYDNLDPADADLNFASVKRVLKKAEQYDLTVKIQATKVFKTPVFYASNSTDKSPAPYNKGDVKFQHKDIECLYITLTDLAQFGLQATWHNGEFQHMFIGGQRSGFRPAKMFGLMAGLAEVDRSFVSLIGEQS